MKLRPDLKTGTVHIVMTAREAMGLADRLVRAAIQSSPGEDWGQVEPSSDDDDEWEQR